MLITLNVASAQTFLVKYYGIEAVTGASWRKSRQAPLNWSSNEQLLSTRQKASLHHKSFRWTGIGIKRRRCNCNCNPSTAKIAFFLQRKPARSYRNIAGSNRINVKTAAFSSISAEKCDGILLHLGKWTLVRAVLCCAATGTLSIWKRFSVLRLCKVLEPLRE